MELLIPGHALWEDFTARLEGDFCRHTLFNATAFLELYAREYPIDVEGTLDWFKNNGGSCDCEILLKIAMR